MSTSKSQRARAAAGKRSQRRRMMLFGALGGLALAVVVGLAIYQSASGSSSGRLPDRVATGEGRVLGDPNAPVTIVEYADFQCPVCKRAETALIPSIEKEYIATGKVKLEFRMYPFIGQESFDAAQAAEAARDQGKFWEYHDALFNAQGRENSGAFSYDNLVKLAEQVGLDVAKFEETLSGNVHLDDLRRERDSAEAAGISSTPTFFVGDQKIVGVQAYATFQQAINQELQKTQQGQ